MISVKDFSKKYRKKVIIEPSSFDIRSNRITFLMGENGAGKTTLIKCLAGLEEYQGDIRYGEGRKSTLVIWDDTPFYSNLTGLQNLYILGEEKQSKDRMHLFAEAYLSKETLKRKVQTYSYGQRKRLALALVEILKPDYLFMDEITNGLDYDTIRFLKTRITKWAEKMTLFLTGHHLDFYNELVEDVLFIREKHIIFIKDFRNREKELEHIYDYLS